MPEENDVEARLEQLSQSVQLLRWALGSTAADTCRKLEALYQAQSELRRRVNLLEMVCELESAAGPTAQRNPIGERALCGRHGAGDANSQASAPGAIHDPITLDE